MECLIDNKLTDKNTSHSYIPTYEKIFSRLQISAKNILEIGICDGGSIKLWNDYFPNAIIYGIDINPAPKWLSMFDRIKTYQDNAYDIEFIQKTFIDKGIKFDIIIDDGPHTTESIKFTVANYSKLLDQCGILVIEDVQKPSIMKDLVMVTPDEYLTKINCVDLRHIKHRWDDLLYIINLG